MNKKEFVASLTIVGPFSKWSNITPKCDKTLQDRKGIGVGIIHRTISTDLGKYGIVYIVLFIDETLSQRTPRANVFSINEIEKEGFESILHKIGKKTMINILYKSSRIDPVEV